MSYQIEHGDCLELMKNLPDGSVDAIICDLPYNLTDCAWDKSRINLPTMWEQFRRILKPCCSAILFASGKFTHKLIASNFDWFKYKWIWVKNVPTMFVHAKNAPMRKFEEICIFSDGVINHATVSTRRMKYNPQGVMPCEDYRPPHGGANVATRGIFKVNGTHNTYGDRPSRPYIRTNDGKDKPTQLRAGGRGERWRQNIRGVYDDCGNALHDNKSVGWYIQEQTGYPMDVIEFDVVPNTKRDHPTQKPVDLLEYLIRTYTNEGETVLDATMGSGSTGVACVNTGRNFIGYELEEKFFEIAQKRIDAALAKKAQELF